MNMKTTAAAALAALAVGCSSGTSSAPRPSAPTAPPTATGSPSATPAVTATSVLKADGYAVLATNPQPNSYEQSAACGVKGTATEEAVVARTDANSQAAVSSLVATLEQDASATGITVAYTKPVVRIRGTLTALAGTGACSWTQGQQGY